MYQIYTHVTSNHIKTDNLNSWTWHPDRMKLNTLHCMEQQCSLHSYTNDLDSCIGDNSDLLNSWLLPIEDVSKLTSNCPNDIWFTKAGGYLKFLYSLAIKIPGIPFRTKYGPRFPYKLQIMKWWQPYILHLQMGRSPNAEL